MCMLFVLVDGWSSTCVSDGVKHVNLLVVFVCLSLLLALILLCSWQTLQMFCYDRSLRLIVQDRLRSIACCTSCVFERCDLKIIGSCPNTAPSTFQHVKLITATTTIGNYTTPNWFCDCGRAGCFETCYPYIRHIENKRDCSSAACINSYGSY